MKTLSVNSQCFYAQMCIRNLIVGIFFVLTPFLVQAQTPQDMISTRRDYKKTVKENPARQMIALQAGLPGALFDLRYAGRNNFMKRRMYPRHTGITFMRRDAVAALVQIQKDLRAQGLGLKVFDAYRPWSVTKKFWDLVQDERYVARPTNGSNHNRGTAVDLTLIELKTGRELNMGTGFDNFTDTAHHSFKNLPLDVLANRELLKTVMERHGFVALETEWWHYTFSTGLKMEVLDIPFKKLKRR